MSTNNTKEDYSIVDDLTAAFGKLEGCAPNTDGIYI